MSGLVTTGAHSVPNTCPFRCQSLTECRRRPECEDDQRRSLVIEGIRQFGLAPDGADLRDLETQITRLTARVAELEGALRPFAEIETSDGMPDGFLRTPDGHAVVFNGFGKNLTIAVTVGDVRRAKAALESKP